MTHVHSSMMRSVMMVIALYAVIILMPNPLMALAPQYATSGDGELVGDVVLFNYNLEAETPNSIPDMAYTTTFSGNTTIMAYAPPEYSDGLALKINQSGTRSGYAQASINTLHAIDGVFNLSFDINAVHCSAVAYEPLIEFSYSYDAGNLQNKFFWNRNNATSVQMVWGGAAFKMAHNSWHHVVLHFNTINDTITWYVDDVLKSHKTGQGLANKEWRHLFWGVPTSPAAGGWIELLFDNVQITIPKYQFQMIPDKDTRSAVSIGFDDGYETDLTVAKDILDNTPGVSNIITGLIGTPGYLDWTQVQQLVDAGWDIQAHSVNHLVMTGLTNEQKRYEFSESKRMIESNTTASVLGWTYPNNAYDATTNLIGWEYYEYLELMGDYLQRYDITTQTDSIWTTSGNYRALRILPGIVYGSYGYVSVYTHAVSTSPSASQMNASALDYFVTKLKENSSKIIVPSDYYREWRNAAYGAITGEYDGTNISFSISYDGPGNYAHANVSVRLNFAVPGSTYVVLKGGELFSTVTHDGGEGLVLAVSSGDYSLMDLQSYRQELLNNAIGPIFTIIPLVMIASIISFVIGKRRK